MYLACVCDKKCNKKILEDPFGETTVYKTELGPRVAEDGRTVQWADGLERTQTRSVSRRLSNKQGA